MKLVRYKGELWTIREETGFHVVIYSVRGYRFDVVPATEVELVDNNYKPTAADTLGHASSVHDTKGSCRNA